jgi:ABC-type multidrug transport system fused ATPase/permease subunit
MKDLKLIISILNLREKKIFYLLVFLTFFSGLLETVGIGLIFPLIKVLIDGPIVLLNLKFLDPFHDFIKSFNKEALFMICFFFLLIIIILKNIFFAFLYWLYFKFSTSVSVRLADNVIKNILSKQYIEFFSEQSSEHANTLITEVNIAIKGCLEPMCSMLTELIILLSVLTFLFYIHPDGTAIIFFITVNLTIAFYLIIKKKINLWSLIRIKSDEKIFKNIYEIFLGIKEIKIFEAERYVIKNFSKNFKDSSFVRRKIDVLHQLPKLWIETAAVFAFFIYFFYYLNFKNNFNDVIPLLAVFVATGFRVATSLNRTLFSYSSIKFNIPSVTKVKKILLLHNDNENFEENIKFNHFEKIEFKSLEFLDVNFFYKDPHKNIFENLNLRIEAGKKIGLKGISGIGKSTFIDLLSGLITPDKGHILINGNLQINKINFWKNILGYVPQGHYLTDDTIKKNIAFGVEEDQIQEKKLFEVLDKTNLDEFVRNLPYGINTIIGERGSKLSGGQKQRIIIARALYRSPQILIFDESTNALDSKMESIILNNIIEKNKSITCIIISHNIKILEKYCDIIYELENKNLRRIF